MNRRHRILSLCASGTVLAWAALTATNAAAAGDSGTATSVSEVVVTGTNISGLLNKISGDV